MPFRTLFDKKLAAKAQLRKLLSHGVDIVIRKFRDGNKAPCRNAVALWYGVYADAPRQYPETKEPRRPKSTECGRFASSLPPLFFVQWASDL
jgi:hypothetical protein